jgi:CRISPR-associated endonuclease/helicase Cas3
MANARWVLEWTGTESTRRHYAACSGLAPTGFAQQAASVHVWKPPLHLDGRCSHESYRPRRYGPAAVCWAWEEEPRVISPYPSRPIAYAHSRQGANEQTWEPLEDHLRNVAEMAERFAEPFGSGSWGRLAGLWHDLGKYSHAFQRYLRASAGTVNDTHRAEVAGKVDHSTAGAQHAARLGPLGRLLAYCIAGHHAGLPCNEGGVPGLSMRLKKQIEPLSAPAELYAISLPSPPKLRLPRDKRRGAFSVAFFTRMLFSCLVDADFLATELFMSPERASQRPRERAGPEELRVRLDAHLEEKERCAPDTPVNHHRRKVLATCREKASLSPGFFSLNVPTGGGKTLSSLAFGLTHAVQYGLRRVVYAIPFTSIIEQTADVFREALGDLADEVLEHHSNLEPEDPKKQSERSRLASENFAAPLVVTTNVQLFESLFSSRTSRCRKLHRLAKSVIVLDEAQTLPPNLLAPTLAALDELVRNYGTTIVLCTATQPAIEKRDGFPIGLEDVTPIIDQPHALHLALRRTQVHSVGKLTDQQVAERLRQPAQVLCVVNTRRHAAELFKLLDDSDALHLSASMCGAHRSEVIAEIRRRLDPTVSAPCRVISTQVVEAGVDVDFPLAYRAAAGLDSVAQTAGRCNREGQLKDERGQYRLGCVMVFDYDEHQHSPPAQRGRKRGHRRAAAPVVRGLRAACR